LLSISLPRWLCPATFPCEPSAHSSSEDWTEPFKTRYIWGWQSLSQQIGWPRSSASLQQLTVCCSRPNHQFTPQGTVLPRKRFAISHLTLQLL
ncbi:unnamed protein product, partial [Gulo gulo]